MKIQLSATVLLIMAVFICDLGWAKPPQTGAELGSALGSGETRTLLPDGRLLVLGGQYRSGTITNAAAIVNSQTGVLTKLPQTLKFGRAWHTATVLPNGTVLIIGGLGPDGQVVGEA